MRWHRVALAVAAIVASTFGLSGGVAAGATPPVVPDPSMPTLAYYYIWFNATSWNRAKADYPVLGRYSSDEPSVIRQHIAWAKSAGLKGFIVSWKNTPQLNRRLRLLARIASAEDFRLAIIYQGLDFTRQPLPAARVGRDLRFFARSFARMRPFQLFSKPLVILSGSWKFSPQEVSAITSPVRDRLLVLASEKNVEGIQRLAGSIDGDAYYWSSVDPTGTPGYAEKLKEMSRVVHQAGGLWIAPAASGFDARLIGGQRVIQRTGGKTLREEFNAAVASSADAVGLISWNEFSENSHIEPSTTYGDRALTTVADLLGTRFEASSDFDSDNTAGPVGRGVSWPTLALTILVIGGGGLVGLRRRGSGRRGHFHD